MIARHTLPSGAWVEIGRTGQVTERQRRPVRMAFARISDAGQAALFGAAQETGDVSALATALSADDQAVLLEVNDLIASALVLRASWLEEGQRVTPDSLLDIPAGDYDAIVELMGPLVGPFMEGVDFSPTPDPASPTPPSSA